MATKTKKPDTAQMKTAITELNEVMGYDPPVDLDLKPKELYSEIKAGIKDDYVDKKDRDKFTEETINFFVTQKLIPVNGTKEVASPKPKAKAKKTKSSKSSKSSKTKETKAKKPGVIATIVSTIQDHGPVTKEKILQVLTKKFPEREPESMAKTINAQVPNRINKEKGLNIIKTEKGYKVK